VATTVCNLGEVERRRGRLRRAAAHYRRALSVWADTVERDHLLVGYGLTGLGQCLLELGEPVEATRALERAVAVLGAQPVDPVQRAEADFALARALAALERDRPRSLELARRARDGYASAGPRGRRQLAEVEAWLEANP
jgi:tetratricopeptide (TPR) repeat protein